MAKVQGNGLTLTFGTSGWNPAITSFARTESTDDIDTSDLATTGNRTYVGGALIEGGTYTFGFQYDPTLTTRPTTGTSETITSTYPVSVSGNTAGNDSFTGYVNSYDIETEINTLITGTFVLKVADDNTETPES
jgi:hypothetical protein